MRKPYVKKPFAKKSLGQNFLTDPNYIRKIINAVDPRPEDTIIEIGPGRGAITEGLVDSGARVIAIELDRDLVPVLRKQFADRGNFVVVERDVLETDFAPLLNADSKFEIGKIKLVANLPYYISTAILQRLAEQRKVFSEMVLMFQKEVVDRITAEPGNSERGFVTVLAEAAFGVERLFDVPPNAFFPMPKVWSSVVRLLPKPQTELDEEGFITLLSRAFEQKRKTLLNNLKPAFHNGGRAIDQAGIDPRRRAETLTLDEWTKLYRSLVQS